MTIKKIIQLIEKNNRTHLKDIELCNEILRKYEELNKTDPPSFELSEKMQRIFLDLITMMKKTDELQVQFNKKIIKMLVQK